MAVADTTRGLSRCATVSAGFKFVLWHCLKVKRAGPIPHDRIFEHLKKTGHQGFFRQVDWHLCPKRIADMLYTARKADTSDKFVMPLLRTKKA